MHEHYDVIIIGSGAGGGTLAYRLAPTGLRVLILERGDYIRRELENWDSREVITKARYKTHEKWIDKDGQQFHPGQHYYVGGQTKFYGAILFRLRETDFGEVRHHGGVSPGVADDLRRPRAVLRPGRAALLRPRRGRRGPDRAGALGALPVSGSHHEPRIQRLHDDFARDRAQPVPPPGRGDARRAEPAEEPVHPLLVSRRLPVHGRGEGRRARLRRPARARARQRHAA